MRGGAAANPPSLPRNSACTISYSTIERLMRTRKLLVLVLLSVATTLLGAAALVSLAHGQALPACHAHAQPAHSPVPINHLCCGVGHQTAILQKCETGSYSLDRVFRVSDSPRLLEGQDSFQSFSRGMVLSSSPPGKTPLRV
jgi:hypothetical protein